MFFLPIFNQIRSVPITDNRQCYLFKCYFCLIAANKGSCGEKLKEEKKKNDWALMRTEKVGHRCKFIYHWKYEEEEEEEINTEKKRNRFT